MDIEEREVDFEKHCETCKYKKKEENEFPCDECLESPINLYTDKPVNWKNK